MNDSSLANNVTIFPRSRAALAVNASNNLHGLQMIAELQKTLELTELFEIFAGSLSSEIPFDGISYKNLDINAAFERGNTSRAQLIYRLTLERQALGELCLSRKTHFTDEEIVLVENRLSALLYPLRNATQYHQAISSAHHDSLTGLLNRLSMSNTLQREIDLARRHKDRFAMLVLDMDGFKQINDQFGHAVGDQALVHVAGILRANVRTTDLLFRYAGDEFVIGLCKTGQYGTDLMANRIRKAVDDSQFVVDGMPVKLRVSVGGTIMAPEDSVDSFFRRADSALYRAKTSGRNKVALIY